MSSEQANQLKLGAAMIQRAEMITGEIHTAFRKSYGNPITIFHVTALHEAMIRRGITYRHRVELLSADFFIPRNIYCPFFEQLVQFYAETPMPSH